ncbi:MAG TPA: hypothetical protein ENN35_06590 [Deltaproteobacteria bacterium]|nr:hypothetical protein [Deltaproteobacteria bacterium]
MMNSSRKIIKAAEVAVTSLKGDNSDAFTAPLWEQENERARSRASDGTRHVAGADVEQRVHDAREKGFRDGVKDEQKRSGEAIVSVMEAVAQVRREWSDLQERFYDEAKENVIRLSVALAEKIIRREVSLDCDILRTMLDNIFGDLKDRTGLTVFLSPGDEQFLKEHGVGEEESDASVRIMADPDLNPGDVLVETPELVVDARIIEQLNVLQQRLIDHDGGEGAAGRE